jgi:hypothetical protein
MTDLDLIDIEASGLHIASYPVEVAVRVRGNVQSWLIKPEPHWTHWDPVAEGLHHLSRERLNREGTPAADVAAALNRLLSDSERIVYSDAAAWDESWMLTLYEATGVTREWRILPIERLLSEAARRRFDQALAERQREHPELRHRAENDIADILAAFREALRSRRA